MRIHQRFQCRRNNFGATNRKTIPNGGNLVNNFETVNMNFLVMLTIILATTFIQVVLSNPLEGISSEYLSKVKDVYDSAMQNQNDAREKLQQYLTAQTPEKVKQLMQQAIDSPSKVKSILEQAGDQLSLPNVDENALWYRVLGKPVRDIGVGTMNLGTKVAGFGVKTIGEFVQLILDGVQDSTDAINERAQNPVTSGISGAVHSINSKVDWFQEIGTSWEKKGNDGINGLHAHRANKKEIPKDPEPNKEGNSDNPESSS